MNRASAILLPVLLLAACGGRSESGRAPARPSFAVVKTARGGPVSLTVRISHRRINLADPLLLEEEVRAEPGFTAELPEFAPDEFEGFGITREEEDPPEKDGKETVLRRRLTLEPEHSGEITIPAREAWFGREAGKEESSVATKPVKITVTPIDNPDAVALPPPRPALTAREIGGRPGPSPWWLLLAVLPLTAAAAVLLRRRRPRATPPRPAHEIAWEALGRLAAAGYVEKGEVERFVVVLSAILREYVERRYSVRAPERTTEEFLAEAAQHPRLAGHRTDLADFLSRADRVKFAKYAPGETDLQDMFDRVKAFVGATEGADA